MSRLYALRIPSAAALACAAALGSPALAGAPRAATQGTFVSLDGLNPSLLRPIAESGALDAPHGLGWLYGRALVVDQAWPAITTLTAASHVSTITCSVPSRHGISANTLIRGGVKMSGFGAPFATEPMWTAAARAGKKVLALAYVGADGNAPGRFADYGVAYPDDAQIAKSQLLELDPATLVAADGWQGGDVADAKETTVTLTLNPATHETLAVNVLVRGLAADGAGAATYTFDLDKDLANGSLGTLADAGAPGAVVDVIAPERRADAAIKGRKRHAFFRLLPAHGAKRELYVSRPTYNNAYPEDFRAWLDAQDLVWPDYGVAASLVTPSEFVEAEAMIDRFLTEVGVRAKAQYPIDIVLFYQPLLDTLGHSWQAKLPVPFDPKATDLYSRAFVQGFKIIDANLSRLFAAGKPSDAIAVMGDHGMDPSKQVINVAALLSADELAKVEIVTSGALAMVYPKAGEDAAAADQVGAALKERLAALRFADASVGGEANRRGDFEPAGTAADFRREWQYGEAAWGYTAGAGFYFTSNVISRDVFAPASALGMHGHSLAVSAMATTLLVTAPGVKAGHWPEASLIDAVPTFAHLLGFAPPKDCLGHVLPPLADAR
jgi:hypothetical protein